MNGRGDPARSGGDGEAECRGGLRSLRRARLALVATLAAVTTLAGAATVRAQTDASYVDPASHDEEVVVLRGRAFVFPGGAEGGRDMAAVGRFLAQDPSRRLSAASVLARATELLKAAGAPDDSVDVLLGETVEALAAEPSDTYPAGVKVVRRVDTSSGAGRWVYDGAAYEAVLARTTGGPLRERAALGLLRCRHPFPGTGLIALLVETEAFLGLAESVTDGRVAAAASDRASLSALHLGRLLLAASRTADVKALAVRLDALSARLPFGAARDVPGRLRGRAGILAAMAGDGTLPFPQEAAWAAGPAPMTVSLEGEIGDLTLVVRSAGSGTARRMAAPVLPVPGSLRVSPDGRSAAWLEVSSPAAVTPMLVSLETGAAAATEEPTPRTPGGAGGGAQNVAADVSMLAGSRPGRDRRRAHVATSLLGFSPDGTRLGLSIVAWNVEPPAGARLSVVETASARLLLDASEAGRGRIQRELASGAVSPRRLHPRRGSRN